MRAWALALFLFALACAPAGASPPVRGEDRALSRIDAELAAGRLDAITAMHLRLRRALAPQTLEEPYRSLADQPLRCATPLLIEARDQLDRLPEDLRERLAPRETTFRRALDHLSPSGRFRLSYETAGTHAVPLADVAPANGVPDYVERAALYLDAAWTEEIDVLGFLAPDLSGGPYPVSFESMGAYGYTALDTHSSGTRLVLHSTFVGFPPNDDPEGDAIGAAKVTAAHEFKHAVQYATSQWSENGLWVEVDATWVEDLVYDDVNDYYNYLGTGSPISAPATSLLSPTTNSGSYEDCVLQHWMSESWGPGIIRSFWERRRTAPTEAVLASYDFALSAVGASLGEDYVDFAAWNYATGTRARPGFGYAEAARYPTAPVASVATSPNANFNGVVVALAAAFHRVSGFSDDPLGRVRIVLDRSSVGSALRAGLVIDLVDGSRLYERMPLAAAHEEYVLAQSSDRIAALGVVVANGAGAGGGQTFALGVLEEFTLPAAVPHLPLTIANTTVETGTSRARGFPVANIGPVGSVLSFEAFAVAQLPAAPKVARSVAGSALTVLPATYLPGGSASHAVTVTNASNDFEWLREVHLTVPAGVSVTSSTHLVGGTSPLTSTAVTGDGVTLSWIDTDGSWGNVRNGQSATATVGLSFDVSLSGDLDLTYRIVGDGYGLAPHEVTGTFVLAGPAGPALDLTSPDGGEYLAVGDTVDVRWDSIGGADLRIEYSGDDGDSWTVLTPGTPDDGRWRWPVQAAETATGRLRLSRVDGTGANASESAFTVYQPLAWMRVGPRSAQVVAGAEVQLQLVFDATAVAPGVHTAQLVLVVAGAAAPLVVPVSMTVTESSTPTGPQRRALVALGNAPNPFNPSTRIRFESGRAQDLRVDVYDDHGRRVRSLFGGRVGAGTQEIAWDSRDDAGRRVGSGVYHYVLAGEDARVTGKMILVK